MKAKVRRPSVGLRGRWKDLQAGRATGGGGRGCGKSERGREQSEQSRRQAAVPHPEARVAGAQEKE